MKYYSMFFIRRRTWVLKAVLILTALWFTIALLTTNGGSRSAALVGQPAVEYEDPEAKPMKPAKPTALKRKSEAYSNNLSDGKSHYFYLIKK